MNKVEINKKIPNTFLLPYSSANFFEIPIPIIMNKIPPALKSPKPADTGSLPKKLIPIADKKASVGLINSSKEK